jgi:hypothetical protein
MFKLLPDLTKTYLLEKVSQEEIMERYTGISSIQVGVKYNVPPHIRPGDENPSFQFKYNIHGRLRATDFAGSFNGDCFDVAASYFSLNTSVKRDFNELLHRIARDFRVHKYSSEKNVKGKPIQIDVPIRPKIVYIPEFRKWNYSDTLWWNLRFTEEELYFNRIFAIQAIWTINSNIPEYSYNKYDPCYGYLIGKDSATGIEEWKFYFPLRKREDKFKSRFISNGHSIQGITRIRKSEYGIVTKSYKDAALLKRFSLFGTSIQAVALPSESFILRENQVKYLSTFWNKIIINCDYDPTGLHNMWEHRKRYGFFPVTFLNET